MNEIATFLLTAAGQFCLFSYWLAASFGHFLAAFSSPIRIAQRLSNSLWASPSEFFIPF
jgi:ABC-type Na+ efflux pump permease subunit